MNTLDNRQHAKNSSSAEISQVGQVWGNKLNFSFRPNKQCSCKNPKQVKDYPCTYDICCPGAQLLMVKKKSYNM
jgi:hypothetical protein